MTMTKTDKELEEMVEGTKHVVRDESYFHHIAYELSPNGKFEKQFEEVFGKAPCMNGTKRGGA